MEDPKEAIMKIPSSVLYVNAVRNPIVNIEKIPAKIDCFKFPIYNLTTIFFSALKGKRIHSFLEKFFLHSNFSKNFHFSSKLSSF